MARDIFTEKELEAIFIEYTPILEAFFYKQTQDHELLLDLKQEVFTNILAHFRDDQPIYKDKIKSFVMVIASNVRNVHYEKKSSTEVMLEQVTPLLEESERQRELNAGYDAGPTANLVEDPVLIVKETVRTAISEIPDDAYNLKNKFKQILHMKLIEDKNTLKIAEITGWSQDTVERKIKAGMTFIRTHFKKEGISLSLLFWWNRRTENEIYRILTTVPSKEWGSHFRIKGLVKGSESLQNMSDTDVAEFLERVRYKASLQVSAGSVGALPGTLFSKVFMSLIIGGVTLGLGIYGVYFSDFKWPGVPEQNIESPVQSKPALKTTQGSLEKKKPTAPRKKRIKRVSAREKLRNKCRGRLYRIDMRDRPSQVGCLVEKNGKRYLYTEHRELEISDGVFLKKTPVR